MAGAIRQVMVRRRSSAVSDYVASMKNEYLGKVSPYMYNILAVLTSCLDGLGSFIDREILPVKKISSKSPPTNINYSARYALLVIALLVIVILVLCVFLFSCMLVAGWMCTVNNSELKLVTWLAFAMRTILLQALVPL